MSPSWKVKAGLLGWRARHEQAREHHRLLEIAHGQAWTSSASTLLGEAWTVTEHPKEVEMSKVADIIRYWTEQHPKETEMEMCLEPVMCESEHPRFCIRVPGHDGDHETVFRLEVYRWPQKQA